MTQTVEKQQYFLGANSAQGFVSLYGDWLDERRAAAVYILKGGAGCGKSTLMRRVAQAMEEQGQTVEYILCSGDPDSLDAIYLPEKRVAILDGTAPHAWRTKVQKGRPGILPARARLLALWGNFCPKNGRRGRKKSGSSEI